MLGDELVGAYLHGSAVLGGLRPHSDIDLLLVTARRTTVEEKRSLVKLLLDLSRSPRSIELEVVVASEIRPWRYPPRLDFQYGDWWREEFEAGELEPWSQSSNRDLASLVRMVLLGDTALYGPPPAAVFDPVPRSDYVDALLKDFPEPLQDLQWDTRNVVLTLPRIWNGIATDEVHSKDVAATWALERLPAEHRPVLERARAIYLGEREDFWDDLGPQVAAYAAYVVAEIERARGRTP